MIKNVKMKSRECPIKKLFGTEGNIFVQFSQSRHHLKALSFNYFKYIFISKPHIFYVTISSLSTSRNYRFPGFFTFHFS